MKKSSILITIIILFISCTKTDITVLNLLQDIKEQNNELRLKILSLQKTTDSLAIALNKNDQMTVNMDKKIDSLRIQLSGLLNQIKDLNTQLTLTNLNIIDVQQKLNELQAKCSSLYSLLNNNFSLTKNLTLNFNSVNSGNCFTLVNTAISGQYFLVLRNGVLMSTDSGTTWSNTNWQLGIIRNISSTRSGAAWSSLLGGQLVVGSMDNGYFISNNNGLNYTNYGPIGFGTGCEAIITLPDGRFVASMAGFPRGIYKSSGTNNNTWTLKWDGNPNKDPIDFTYYKNKIMFAVHTKGGCCSPDGGLLKSIDDGENWSKISSTSVGLYDCEILGDSLAWADNNGNYFITDVNNPNFNVDARFNFLTNSKTSTSSLTDVDMKYYLSKNLLVATSNSGISVSTDRGFTWKTYTIVGVSNYYNITFADGNLFVCTNIGLYKSAIY